MAGERILRCYDLLVAQARRGFIVTYGEFAPSLGVTPIGMGTYLMPILNWCRDAKLPELPIIVVSKRTGRPSGPYERRSIGPKTAQVFMHDWDSVERPSAAVIARFRRRLIRGTSTPHPSCLPAASGGGTRSTSSALISTRPA